MKRIFCRLCNEISAIVNWGDMMHYRPPSDILGGRVPLSLAGCTPLHTTRTTYRACRACRGECVERVEPCLFQRVERQSIISARVYKFSLLCSGFASISEGTTSGKGRWTCMLLCTRVHALATPLNTCHATVRVALVVTGLSRRAVRQERHVSTRLVTSRHDFSLCQNAWAR